MQIMIAVSTPYFQQNANIKLIYKILVIFCFQNWFISISNFTSILIALQQMSKSIKQSTKSMLRCSPNQFLVSYSSKFKNNTLIYSSHIDFNGQIIKHDRNSQAYQAAYTVNECFVVIFVEKPHAVQLFDLRNGDFMVARGLNEIYSYKIVSATTQIQYGVRPAQHNRKIYMILQDKGKYYLQAIQIDQKIENNPKERLKLMEQPNVQLNKQFLPVFSSCRWNLFIMISKNILKICKLAIKNNEINFQFAAQNLQNKISQVFSNNEVIGMAENKSTWAILIADDSSSNSGNANMLLMVFWQHYFSPELIKNMYYRDQSYIKSVTIPCNRKQFVRMWEVDGFYIIETKGSDNSHFCHIVFQEPGFYCTTLKLSYDSITCPYSLSNSSSQISICEVVNRNQLNKTILSQCSDSQITQQTRCSSNNNLSTSGNNQSPKTSQQSREKNQSQKIKKFNVVQEVQKVEIKSYENQGKSTAKKSQRLEKTNESPKMQQTRSLIDAKLVEHFERMEQQNKAKQEKEDQELQVPDSLQPLISFGRPSDPKPNKTNNQPTTINPTNNALISFGTQNKVVQSIKQPKQIVIQNQLKEDKKLKPQQVKQIKQEFLKCQQRLMEQLKDRSESLQENYDPHLLAELIKIHQLFDPQEILMLHMTINKLNQLQVDMDRNRKKLADVRDENVRKINKLSKNRQKLEIIFSKISLNINQKCSIFNSEKPAPKRKQFHEQLKKILQQFDQRMQYMQNKIKLYQAEMEEYFQKRPTRIYSLNSTNKIMNFLFSKKVNKKVQKCIRIPIFQLYYYTEGEPLFQIEPLPL